MKIDRVIELDMNTDRKNELIVRIVQSAPHRQEIIPHEPDSKLDLIVMMNGTLACILEGESNGTFKKGEGIKKFIQNLEQEYIDINISLNMIEMDENGEIFKKK